MKNKYCVAHYSYTDQNKRKLIAGGLSCNLFFVLTVKWIFTVQPNPYCFIAQMKKNRIRFLTATADGASFLPIL